MDVAGLLIDLQVPNAAANEAEVLLKAVDVGSITHQGTLWRPGCGRPYRPKESVPQGDRSDGTENEGDSHA